MKLTTRGRYAVTAMLDLAINGGPQPVSLADISGRQEISLSYLEQLFAKLRRKQLVISARGPGGGYRLARSGTDIFVAQIIKLDSHFSFLYLYNYFQKSELQFPEAFFFLQIMKNPFLFPINRKMLLLLYFFGFR